MITESMFPNCSLDRSVVHWEDYIDQLTPVDAIENFRVKREDCFAPLGYGGVNGGKVRQLLWVFKRYLESSNDDKPGVLMAGSVKSPLLARVPVVAKHLGMACHLIIASEPRKSALKNESVNIALHMGATFSRCNIGYNPALQRMAKQLHEKEEYSNYYLMEYGLSVGGNSERIEAFYRFGAEQAKNIPDDVETLLLPAGSCNTLLAVLYGVALYPPARLKEVILFGIAPNRIAWFEERLKLIESVSGVAIGNLFSREYLHNRELQEAYTQSGTAPYKLKHYDLHTTKFAGWGDLMPATVGGLALHPLYEGKIWQYMQKHPLEFEHILRSERVMLWVVGTEATWSAMEPYAGGVAC